LPVERGSLCSDRIVAAFSVIAQWIDGALGIDKIPQLLAE
jgi:hypothetical protein